MHPLVTISFSFSITAAQVGGSVAAPLYNRVKLESGGAMPSVYDFTMKRIDGRAQPLADYKGKVLLFVNVASFCGNTPQYAELESLYQKYHGQGLEILGFPANNFGAQEPGTNKEIAEFCKSSYGVTFPLFSKISVKGDDKHPLYNMLTSAPPPAGGEVTWNFQKFLVDRQGAPALKVAASTSPQDKAVVAKVEELLKAP